LNENTCVPDPGRIVTLPRESVGYGVRFEISRNTENEVGVSPAERNEVSVDSIPHAHQVKAVSSEELITEADKTKSDDKLKSAKYLKSAKE